MYNSTLERKGGKIKSSTARNKLVDMRSFFTAYFKRCRGQRFFSFFLRLYLNFLQFFKTIMYVVWIIIASLTYRNCEATDGALVNVNKYCRDRDRLITSEENDEYLLVGAENNTNIMLACRYW